MAGEVCNYSWNGVEWILQGSVNVGKCKCAASHWGPEPEAGKLTMTIDAKCPDGPEDPGGPGGVGLSLAGEDLQRFVEIGGGKANHKLKKDNFPILNAEWDERMTKGMDAAGIKIKPSQPPK